MARDYRVIDADTHVNPRATFWADYLPKHLRDLAPRIEPGDECDWVVFEGKRKKLAIIGAVAGKKVEEYKLHGHQSEQRPGNWEPAARLRT